MKHRIDYRGQRGQRGQRGRRGLTLIEVMAGVFVLSMAIMMASAIFPVCTTLRDRSGCYSRAAALIQRKMEQIRRMDSYQINYANLQAAGIVDAGIPQDSDETNGPFSCTFTDRLPEEFFDGKGKVTLTGVGTDVVRVQLEMTWRGFKGTPARVDATTFVADKRAWREP